MTTTTQKFSNFRRREELRLKSDVLTRIPTIFVDNGETFIIVSNIDSLMFMRFEVCLN